MLSVVRLTAVAALAALASACATTSPPAPAAAPPSPAPSPAAAAAAPAAKPADTAAARLAPASPHGAVKGAPAAAAGAAPAAPAGAAAAPAAAGGPRPGDTPPLRPFADVVKDAKEIKGYFTVWQKDDRTFLEIRNDQLDQPFFLGWSLASGLGERFFLPGLMGQEQVVSFRRINNGVQLIARNLRVRAPAGTPLETAVRESYSDSLVMGMPMASAVHPERKSFLIDAAALVGADHPGAQTALEAAYRLSYGFDRGNSYIERVRATDAGTFITFRAHYAVPKLPAPPATPPSPGTPLPMPPSVLPDPRSLFLSFAYTLAPLPEQPMRPRVADQRVGHFTTAFWDFGNVGSGDARTHFVERWRLEKKDPAAELSEPKQPILVWMDRNIPDKYRPAVRAGILEWNKAFEKAGFKDAIVVQQQPADADWSTVEGTRHLAVRWFAMQGPGAVAVGPSQADPRSGEILRGAAIIPDNWVRITRSRLADTQPRLPAVPATSLAALLDDARLCSYSLDALEQAAFGFELLAARNDLDPDGPEAERFVAASLKDVVMHEVGHALGLRHNFKASTGIRFEQLRDAAFTARRGISNSVMDYNALNIPLDSEPVADYTQTTLGEYDYWAIEYAYRELPAEQEAAELKRIAARAVGNPALAYATDEDVAGAGIDPLANQFDLGDDPLAYYRRSFTLARELWARTQKRQLADGDTFAVYRRNLTRGLARFGEAVPVIGKFVGGVHTTRDLAGSGTGTLFSPVPAARQREALDLLAKEVFSADSFRFDPAFMSRLGVDHLDRFVNPQAPMLNTDFSLASSVLAMQRAALDQLLSDGVAARLADAETKLADPRQALSLAEVHGRIADAVWSELKSGREIDSLRRNLQREHARRVAGGLVRPASPVAADVRAVNRAVALRLQADLQRALAGPRLNPTTRAHLAETQALIAEALRAPLVKQGV